MFMYIHSPEHPFTPSFCRETLSSELSGAVSWCGFHLHLATTLKASGFPFCAMWPLLLVINSRWKKQNLEKKIDILRWALLQRAKKIKAISKNLQLWNFSVFIMIIIFSKCSFPLLYYHSFAFKCSQMFIQTCSSTLTIAAYVSQEIYQWAFTKKNLKRLASTISILSSPQACSK